MSNKRRVITNPLAAHDGHEPAFDTDEPFVASDLSAGAVDLELGAESFRHNSVGPLSHDMRVEIATHDIYVFTVSDFPFHENPPGGHLVAVDIRTLPSAGRLTLDGVDVSAGQSIGFQSIAAGKLVFSYAADVPPSRHVAFTFAVVDASGAASSDEAMKIDLVDVDGRPTTHNSAVTTPRGSVYVFRVSNFPFAESGSSLAKVEIESLPGTGTLTLAGGAVRREQKIAIEDIAAGKLVYTPPAGANGFDFSEFRFEVVDRRGRDSAAATLTINVVIPPTLTIAPIDGNDVINAAEAHAGVPLSGTVTGIAPARTFLVSVSDAGVVKTYTATVDAAGTGWTAFIPAADALALSNGVAVVAAQVTDVNGISSAPASRQVTVVETAPVLTPIADQTDEATSAAGAAATFTATAADALGAADTVVFTEGNAVVHSGDTFSLGVHVITASATDVYGNTASESFTITMRDTTPPALTTVADQTDEATGPAGATASFAASATDLVDGADTVVFTEGNIVVHSGDTFGIGAHTVTASATDVHGNTASESFAITIRDSTPPVLTPVADQTIKATGTAGATASFTASATDLVDGTDTVVFTEGAAVVHSGDTFGVGTHAITASATDAHGNTASEGFTITVTPAAGPPTPVFDLAASDQTGPVGAHQTRSAEVALVGTTGANDVVTLSTGQTTIASNTGAFRFANVDLALGDNPLTVTATDATGETASFSLTVQRLAQAATGNAAIDWNHITLDTIRDDGTAPPVASRNLAMESLAVLDSVNAINGTPGYLVNMSAPAGASADAAVIAAAHAILTYLYPARQGSLDASYAASLAQVADGQSKTDGIALGVAVANQVVQLRLHDGWDNFVDDEGRPRSASGGRRRRPSLRRCCRNGRT